MQDCEFDPPCGTCDTCEDNAYYAGVVAGHEARLRGRRERAEHWQKAGITAVADHVFTKHAELFKRLAK